MRKRSRNIRTLPVAASTAMKYPSLGVLDEKQFFGEEIIKGNQTPLFAKNTHNLDDSCINEEFELIHLSMVKDVGNSSSSSLSWGHEYNDKSEAFRMVSDELKRMDSVLSGLEPIPKIYDSSEYKEWMRHFPSFCVIGTPLKVKNIGKISQPIQYSSFEEILSSHPETEDQKQPEPELDNVLIGKDVMELVVESVCKKVGEKIFKSKIPVRVDEKSKFGLKNLDITIDVGDYLKVSPIHRARIHENDSTKVSSYKPRAGSTSSKWLKHHRDDSDDDFISLPFLTEDFNCNTNKTPFSGSLPRTKNPSNKGVFRKGILKNPLVLPPIEGVQYRSASATPRRPTVTFSAISFHNNNKGKPSRVETAQQCRRKKSCGQISPVKIRTSFDSMVHSIK